LLPLLNIKGLIPGFVSKHNTVLCLLNSQNLNCYGSLTFKWRNFHCFSIIQSRFLICRKKVEYWRYFLIATDLTFSYFTLGFFNILYRLILLLFLKVISLWLNYTLSLAFITYFWVKWRILCEYCGLTLKWNLLAGFYKLLRLCLFWGQFLWCNLCGRLIFLLLLMITIFG
jgi:hypothetical protein